jgi:hypothetical protein
MSGPFVWRYRSSDGDALGESEQFADRSEAEAWLSEAWEDLAHIDVDAVELVDVPSAATVFRMSLGTDEGGGD